MNIDIQTEHAAMRPDWHRTIDAWVARCARHHPGVTDLDVTLRHDAVGAHDEVAAVATVRGQTASAVRQADTITGALHEALDALEHQLLVLEPVRREA